MRHQQRLCTAADCGLRFPVAEGSELGASCPHCGAPTGFVEQAYASHEIREGRASVGPPVEALLDNIRSLRNVGSMFRTADGAGVRHMHLCGFTPTPEHPKMAKTALGAEASVGWSHDADAAVTADRLVGEGRRLWALEGGPRSVDLFDLLGASPPSTSTSTSTSTSPIVLVLGHEVSGVDPRVLERCEQVARIPMAGVKGSLNVSVAFGIAAYWLRHGVPR